MVRAMFFVTTKKSMPPTKKAPVSNFSILTLDNVFDRYQKYTGTALEKRESD